MPGTLQILAALVGRFSPVLALAWFGWGNAWAQAPGAGSEVAQRRAAFEKTIHETLEPLNRKYATALRRMEKELAIQKNYEAAIALRDERLAAEAMLPGTGDPTVADGGAETPGSPAGSAEEGEAREIVFAASAAAVRDGSESPGEVVLFTETGQQAEWVVDVLPAGGYEVFVTYACAADSAFQIKEHFFRLACEAPASGGSDAFRTVSFGTLKVTSRASAISLTIESIASGSPLQVREIKLVSNRD